MTANDTDNNTKRYLNRDGLAALLHLSRSTLDGMYASGALLSPDVQVFPSSPGWDRERSHAFGVEGNLIAEDGSKYTDSALMSETYKVQRHRRTARLRSVSANYQTSPKPYVSSVAISRICEQSKLSAYFKRDRGNLRAADVAVGQRALGWEEVGILQHLIESSSVDDEMLDRWMHRRVSEFGMDHEASWVRRRLKTMSDERRTRVESEIRQAVQSLEQFGPVSVYQRKAPDGA